MTDQVLKYAPYRRLCSDAAEIRVLEVLQGQGEIKCKLHHTLITETPFEALSYVWTPESRNDPKVNIDGEMLTIRHSLADALTRFRRLDASRMMWVDAVCIDQQDVQEKNRQVRLMRDIFAASKRTLIWLGPADESTAEGFNLARERAAVAREDTLRTDDEIPHTVDVFSTAILESRQWYALSNLHAREWFRRAWIVQEVTVASEATLVCGEHEMDWTDLVIGNQDIQFASTSLRRLGGGLTKSANPAQREDLTAVLARNRQRQATLSVDKIYAFLGLVDSDQRYGIAPDYNRSEEDLLLRLTIDSIRTRGDLGIFSASTHHDLSQTKRPSWLFSNTYDASRDTLASESFAWRAQMWGGEYFPTFNACGDSVAQPVYNASAEAKSLTLHGSIFDEVVEIGRHRKGYRRLVVRSYLYLIQKWPEAITEHICYLDWRRVSQIANPSGYYEGRERQAFWETTYGGVLPRYHKQAERDWSFIDGELKFLWQLPQFLYEFRPLIGLFYGYFLLRGLVFALLGVIFLVPVCRFAKHTTASYNRRLFRTKQGAIGLGPNTTRVGDHVTILDGGKVPILLREVSSSRWELVGESYVHGIMQGEAFDSKQSRPFVLI